MTPEGPPRGGDKTFTGFEVTIKAFMPVDRKSTDSIMGAAAGLEILARGLGSDEDVGRTFRAFHDVSVTQRFVNKRKSSPA